MKKFFKVYTGPGYPTEPKKLDKGPVIKIKKKGKLPPKPNMDAFGFGYSDKILTPHWMKPEPVLHYVTNPNYTNAPPQAYTGPISVDYGCGLGPIEGEVFRDL